VTRTYVLTERAAARPATPGIQALARRAAAVGLRLRQAQALADALILADALGLEGGNVSAAARRLGVDRPCLHRMMARTTIKQKDGS
jgi:DNA-binding NtrC family response regulator